MAEAATQDEQCVQRMMQGATAGATLQLSTAYFNLTPPLEAALAHTPARVQLLTAAPSAHGWHGASGVARLLPRLYQHLQSKLLRRLCSRKPTTPDDKGDESLSDTAVALLEYCRPDWQFHAKGLWCAPVAWGSHGSPWLLQLRERRGGVEILMVGWRWRPERRTHTA
jgi:hypothetical protein